MSLLQARCHIQVCLSKCKIHMSGVQEDRADPGQSISFILDCIEADVSGTLAPLRPMLAPNRFVIQVHVEWEPHRDERRTAIEVMPRSVLGTYSAFHVLA